MAGVEAIAVLGLISSIISIVDVTKKVYDAATDAQGLPEAFREVAGRLPIIENILGSTKQDIEERRVNDDSCKGVKHIVEACEKKAKKLEKLFRKTIPKDGASDLKRYYKAVKTWGKGNAVESLMQGMLKDVQLLACQHGMKTATQAQQEQIVKAITEVSALSPSVPEHEFQVAGFTNTNSGPGTQNNYNTRGKSYIAQGTARQYNNSNSGDIHFVETHHDARTLHLSVPLGPNETEAYYACLRALFLTNPRDDRETLKTIKGPRVDGTCEWIKGHPRYKSWLRSQSQLLWLSGGPGKGKTMLSIFLATELEKMARPSQNELFPEDKLFLQYFCDNKDEKRNTAVAILRGLIFRLLRSCPKLLDHILPSFEIQKESLFFSTSFETLWRIFESMACDPALETTYCVLDGLDECDEASLKILLGKFTALLSAEPNGSSACRLNLLIVSRDLPDFIPELLSEFSRISLDPDADTEINKDIDLFIKAKVKELSKRKQYPERLRVHVEDVFRDRAQGTFLWIGIVAHALRRYKATQVEEALDLFPPGLDELYARILLQIDSRRREIAARILRWVVMAARPLTVSELSIAMKEYVKMPFFTPVEVIREYVSNDCRNILVIKKDKAGLIHQSAKDYLLRKTCDPDPALEFFRVKEEVANLEIARRCLDYLESGALENRECEPEWLLRNPDHLREFPLLSYAVLHWHEHARSLARSDDTFDLSRPFYYEKSQVRTSWLEAYWGSEIIYVRPQESFTLLHVASYFGILPLAENLVLAEGGVNKTKHSDYLNKVDDEGTTALMRAAQQGHEAVVRLLLDKGADIEAIDERGETALMVAARCGYEAVVRLLLEKGADIRAIDKYGRTALIIAAGYGYEAVVQLLLEKGADIEAIDERGETALMEAAEYGREAVVQLLLEKRADIRAIDKYRRTALIIAAGYGYEAVVQALLEKGADIGAFDNNGKTALMIAAEYGYEAVVHLLLEKGPHINATDKYRETALIKAAEYGHEAIVQLLLEKGSHINATDKDGETALIKAAEYGHEAIVQLLLKKGADIEAKTSSQMTTVMIAARRGNEAVVQLLLEKGADINGKDKDGETALMKAERREWRGPAYRNSAYEAIIRMLTPNLDS